MPGLPVRSRIPSQPREQSAGQARTGTGAVRPRDCLDAPGGNFPGKSSRTPRRDSQARRPRLAIASWGSGAPTASSAAHALPIGLARLMQTA